MAVDRGMEAEAERIYGQYHTLLSTVVRGILGDGTEDWEACVQDVIWEFLRAPGKFDPARGSEKTYLCVLARSRARTLRARRPGGAAGELRADFVRPGRRGARGGPGRAAQGAGGAQRGGAAAVYPAVPVRVAPGGDWQVAASEPGGGGQAGVPPAGEAEKAAGPPGDYRGRKGVRYASV